MAALSFEVRQLFRSVGRQPGFFTVAALTLAVGFAAHLSAFTLVDRMLLAPPAGVQQPDRVFRLHIDREYRGGRFLWFQTPWQIYQGLRHTPDAFTAIAAYRSSPSSIGSGSDARPVTMVFADAGYFPLLGASAQLGRVFSSDEDRPPAGAPVVVLSDTHWRSAYGADPAILGRTARIGAVTYTVIGVMPPHFNGDISEPIDAWAPFHAGAYELPTGWDTSVVFRSASVIVRLADEITKDSAAERAGATYRRIAEGTPSADATAVAVLSPLEPGRIQQGALNPSGKIALWIEGVALLVLLVAVANVVNLQMSRAVQQRRELAVRVALGAGRGRLLAKTLLEMLFVSGSAALLGVLLTFWSATILQELVLPGTSGEFDFGRFAVVAITTVAIVTVLCAGLSFVQVRVGDINHRLKTGRGGEGFTWPKW